MEEAFESRHQRSIEDQGEDQERLKIWTREFSRSDKDSLVRICNGVQNFAPGLIIFAGSVASAAVSHYLLNTDWTIGALVGVPIGVGAELAIKLGASYIKMNYQVSSAHNAVERETGFRWVPKTRSYERMQ